MAVQFDSVASDSGYPPDGISFSHSLGYGVGSNRMVFVAVTTVGGLGSTVASCTYDGIAMNLLAQVSETYYGRDTIVRIYYLMDSAMPSTSGSKTVAVSFNGTPYWGLVSAISYTGAKQSAPAYASDSGNGDQLTDPISTSITVAAELGLLVDFCGIDSSGSEPASCTPGSGQTERSDYVYQDASLVISDKVFTSSGSNSMTQSPSWNYAGWGHIIAELEPAGEIVLLGSDSFNGDSSTSVSGSYTCHAGDNRKLLVAVTAEQASTINVDSVTYNGVSLTKVMETDNGANCLAWFYLDDASFPSTPGAYTIQANFSDTAFPGVILVLELAEAKQGSIPYNSSISNDTELISTSLTVENNYSWLVGAVTSNFDVTYTPTTGQTELLDQTGGGGGGGASAALGVEEIPIAGSESMGWDADGFVNRMVSGVLEVPPASATVETYNAILIGTNF